MNNTKSCNIFQLKGRPNYIEQVTINLSFFTIYRVPITVYQLPTLTIGKSRQEKDFRVQDYAKREGRLRLEVLSIGPHG